MGALSEKEFQENNILGRSHDDEFVADPESNQSVQTEVDQERL